MQTERAIGFDFGTSNCAVGIMQQQQVQLLNLGDHGRFMPSTLFAPQSELISACLFRDLAAKGHCESYQQARGPQLAGSQQRLLNAKKDGYGQDLLFGQAALAEYLEDPSDCYYVRSPKSFLGASGISLRYQQQFEDICAAMMLHIKSLAEQNLGAIITKAVIGRPVNFQGINSQQSNRQAIDILTHAARFAGFESVEFLYEPIAAGLAYQEQLTQTQRVLVVDIGGGTSDISMLQMGPEFKDNIDHQSQVLGYSGERIGGNDFDIALNREGFMPYLGSKLQRSNGQALPITPFWDAAAVNDFPAQSRFYSQDTALSLQQWAKAPELAQTKRLATLQRERLTHQLSACAEKSKIALSQSSSDTQDLGFLERGLQAEISQPQYQRAATKLLDSVLSLSRDVISQAGCQPEVIFLTGGSANSPLVSSALNEAFSLPLKSADNFGSVTSGLSLWAERIFK